MLKHIFSFFNANSDKLWKIFDMIYDFLYVFFPIFQYFLSIADLICKREGLPRIWLHAMHIKLQYTALSRWFEGLLHLASIFNTPYLHPCGHPCKYYSLGWFFILLFSRKIASFSRAVNICAFEICICVIHNVCASVFGLIFHFSLLS